MATNEDERTDVFDPKTGMFYDSADGPPDPESAQAKASRKRRAPVPKPAIAPVDSRSYKYPDVARVGPVRSGSLREFEDEEPTS
jgi:hypothetical protein